MGRLLSVALVLLCVRGAVADASSEPDYLPLQVGNRWDYANGAYGWLVSAPGGDTYLDTGYYVLDLWTFSAVPNSIAVTLTPAEGEAEFVKQRGSEFSIEVVGVEAIAGNSYYRMSTGQLLRNDREGRLMEYRQPSGPEGVLFDFPRALAEPNAMWSFGTLLPFARSFFGWPSHQCGGHEVPGLGWLPDVIEFVHSDGNEAWGVAFARGYGVVTNGEGGDTGASQRVLTSWRINGKELDPTAVAPSSWGGVKGAFRQRR